MSYADEAALSQDLDFRDRLTSCLYGEAKLKTSYLAKQILTIPQQGLQMFMPFISTAPGFGEQFATDGQAGIEDAELLSAVQANWAAVEALYPEPS